MKPFVYSAAIALLVTVANANPSFADDSLWFVNHIDDKDSETKTGLEITVDGQEYDMDEDEQAAKKDRGIDCVPDPVCPAPITLGNHKISVTFPDGHQVEETIGIDPANAATNLDLMPKDKRIWCVSVTTSQISSMSTLDCKKVVDAE